MLHYSKKSILKIFKMIQGQKDRFQQLWIYKIFEHRKLPCIPCLGETHIKLQWYDIYPSLIFIFFGFATQLFSTPVTSLNLHNQAPLFTELCLLQATPILRKLIEWFLIYHCFCIITTQWHLHWWAI